MQGKGTLISPESFPGCASEYIYRLSASNRLLAKHNVCFWHLIDCSRFQIPIKILHAGVVKTISLAGVGQINVQRFCQIPIAESGVNRTLITMKERRTKTCQLWECGLSQIPDSASIKTPRNNLFGTKILDRGQNKPTFFYMKESHVCDQFLPGFFRKNSLFNLSMKGRLSGIFGSRRQCLNLCSLTREFRSFSLISQTTRLWLIGVSRCILRNLAIRFAP